MFALTQLHAGHASAVLAFELANRAYFAATISDRGDDFFDDFADLYNASLAEQHAGSCAFYVLLADGGAVLGRFNLYNLDDPAGDGRRRADVGYRVAQHATGRGVATRAVRELCRIAVVQHGLQILDAATTLQNSASQRVLIRAGFTAIGPADPARLGGKPGTRYQRDLAAAATPRQREPDHGPGQRTGHTGDT